MKKILFVCTGNTCRSPMAEAILRELASQSDGNKSLLEAASAGLHAQEGAPMSMHSIDALIEMGIPVHNHKARQLTAALAQQADLILTMTASHLMQICRYLPQEAHKVHTLKAFAFGSGDNVAGADNDIQDPYGGTIASYRSCAKEIADCVRLVLEKL